MELVPAFYKNIHPYMPMTYTINALRDNILNMNITDYSKSMSVLTITLICGLLFIFLLSLLRHIIRSSKEKRKILCQ